MPSIINCSWNTSGNLIPTSSDTTVATVASDASIAGETKDRIIVTPIKAGTCTITINVSDDGIHSEIEPRECAVQIVSKSAITPDIVQKLVQNGQAVNQLAVGDKLPFTLSGSVTGTSVSGSWYARILGFNHNSDIEGSKTLHLHFPYNSAGTALAFIDSYYGAQGSSSGFRINLSNTCSGGWKSSYMKNTVMVQMYATMTAEWKSVIKDATKYTDNVGTSTAESNVTASTSKVWLLAEWEVFGVRTRGNTAEQRYQQRYKYFQNGASAIKYRYNSTSTATEWWLSSLYPGRTDYPWLTVTAGGSEDYWYADRSYGLAPLVVIA